MARNLKFPLGRGKDGYFELTETTLEAIKQNLLLFFATDEGERVVNNQLGSRFRKYIFEGGLENIKLKCENEVNRIFGDYFPQLVLEDLEVVVDEANANMIRLDISYSFKNLKQLQDTISVVVG